MAEIVIPQEEPSFVHSDEHPFCGDPECPCHNQDAYETYLEPALNAGQMTGAQALRMYWDQ